MVLRANGYWAVVLALTGCQQTFRLRAQDVPTVVERYRTEGRVVLLQNGEHYEVTAEQQPQLALDTDTCYVAEGATEADCGNLSAPLENVRAFRNGKLAVPGLPSLSVSQLLNAELELRGKSAPRVVPLSSQPRRARLAMRGSG